MKKVLFSLLVIVTFAACGNDQTTESNEAAPVTPGADNVNGNIPDTTDAIRLNQSSPKDSSNIKDSTR
ncbi:MAG: hypothetical protein EOO10_23730 [Chitinophagaceae bacterium]|nr:MAG: hypothetical protein EOO10_23730 [Chitinophagaceae bacterium]